jgi:hypothetical protein
MGRLSFSESRSIVFDFSPALPRRPSDMALRYHHPEPSPESSGGAPDRDGNGVGASENCASAEGAGRASSVPGTAGPEAIGATGQRRPRLSLLLTYGGWRECDFADQLPALLGPLGIDCFRCRSGVEATDFLRRSSVHIAIVDLSIPMEPGVGRSAPAGPRVLQLLRRLDQPPPTVVVRPPQPSTRDSARGLSDALRDGAFAVIDGPVRLECMLETLRRVVRRHYRDHGPAA